MAKFKMLALAAAIAASTSAGATVTDWGTHDDPVEVGVGILSTGPLVGFTDIYKFVLADDSMLTSSVGASNTAPILNIIGGTYSLISYGADGNLGTGDDSVVGTWSYSGSSSSTTFSVLAGAGKYLYAVSGVTTGSYGGVYTLTSTIAPVPVPEPQSYLMLMAGLGLFGLVAKRGRR